MSYLSKRDLEDLRPDVGKLIHKVVGNVDDQLLSVVENCLSSGYERRKICDKLNSFIDSKKASRLTDKLENLIEDYKASSKSRKRNHDDDRSGDSKKHKSKVSSPVGKEGSDKPASEPNFSSFQIKQMMANAQREIEERKKKLDAIKNKTPGNSLQGQMQIERGKLQSCNSK
jgi:U4/U6 small nuclear ribonucleoprotein PRP3